MDFSIKGCDWSKGEAKGFLTGKSDCIVLGIFEAQTLSGAALDIDTATKGLISRVVKAGDMDGKRGKTLFLHEVSGIGASRVLLVGLGKQDAFNQKAYNDAVTAAWRALLATKVVQVTFSLAQLPVDERSSDWGVRAAILALRNETYRFTQMKSKPEPASHTLKRVVFSVDPADEKAAKVAVKQAVALANGMDLTRDLGNLPGNVCTPTYLGNTAKKIAKDWGLKAEVLGLKQIQALKMGSFLSVARASVEPPQFIVLHYQGAAAKAAPVVLVGKGITFDTGGISLKPGEGMDEMKYDMCGAGSVLGTIRAVAEMGLKINVVAIVPTCENMPGGNATKPGDIVTSMKGADDRGAEHRRRRPPDPVRRTHVRRAFQAGRRDRRRDADGRLRDRAGRPQQRAVLDERRARGRTARRVARGERPGMAHAARRRVPGSAEVEFRGSREHRRAPGRRRDGRVLPVALHRELPVGPPRHRGHRVEGRCREGRDGPSGAVARAVPDRPRRPVMAGLTTLRVRGP